MYVTNRDTEILICNTYQISTVTVTVDIHFASCNVDSLLELIPCLDIIPVCGTYHTP